MDHNKGSDDGVEDFMKSYLLHSFLQVRSVAEPFTSNNNLHNYVEPKPFSLVKRAYVGFSSSIFIVQDHISSSAGDVPRAHTLCQSLHKILNTFIKGKNCT
jgi:hypothetical protein